MNSVFKTVLRYGGGGHYSGPRPAWDRSVSGGDDLNNIVIKQEDQFHGGMDGDQDMKGYSVPGFNDSDGGVRDHDSLYDR